MIRHGEQLFEDPFFEMIGQAVSSWRIVTYTLKCILKVVKLREFSM